MHKVAGYHGPHLGPTLRAGHSWMQKGESAADWRGGGAATNRMKEIGEAAPAASAANQAVYVDVDDCDDEEGALRWVEQAVGVTLPRPMHEALKSGAVLCQLMNKIRPGERCHRLHLHHHRHLSSRLIATTSASTSPGIVDAKLETESAKPFEQMARIDSYLKASEALKCKSKFMTVDLHDNRAMIQVVRQIWSLAVEARKQVSFPGPQLSRDKLVLDEARKVRAEQEAAAEAERAAAEKEARRAEPRGVDGGGGARRVVNEGAHDARRVGVDRAAAQGAAGREGRVEAAHREPLRGKSERMGEGVIENLSKLRSRASRAA